MIITIAVLGLLAFASVMVVGSMMIEPQSPQADNSQVWTPFANVKFFAVLGLVFLLLAGFAWFARKYGHQFLLTQMRGRHIKVIEVTPLTQKARIGLVEVNGQKMLIGITDQSVQLLSEIETESEEEQNSKPETFSEIAPRHRFSHYLKRLR